MAEPGEVPAEDRRRSLFLSLLFAAAFVAAICLLSPPRWETNDDVSMSMIAHGYGGAAFGSSNLVFSNVIWGELARWLPNIHGVPGYSVATLAVMAIVCWAVAYFLLGRGLGLVLVGLAVAAVLLRPIAFPQFTITAGLPTVVGVLALSSSRSTAGVMIAALLFFLAFLVRREEFLLVLIVGLPFLPWKDLINDRRYWMAAGILLVACVAAGWLDQSAYQGEEWAAFQQLNPLRAQFTDYGAAAVVKAQPDLLRRHGFSENDIDLLSNWFFVDPKIADPGRLRAMLLDAGGFSVWTFKPWLGVKAISTLWQPVLLPFVLGVAALFAIRPTRKTLLGAVLLLVCVFMIGLLGRPGLLRVFYPLLGLLWLLSLSQFSDATVFARRSAILVAAVLFGWNVYLVWTAPVRPTSVKSIADALSTEQPIVVWGGSFPFEFAYPVLAPQSALGGLQIYGLGTTTLAPFSRAAVEEKSGRGFLKRLQSDAGVPLIVNASYLPMLSTYCLQHLGTEMHEVQTRKVEGISIRWMACKGQQ
jgi:hypothetical protein